MKEYELDNITLMGGWYISNKVCSDIIKFMKKQTLVDGMMYAGSETNYEQKIVTDMKESKEMAVDFKNENEPFHTYKQQLDKVVKEYLKKYPYMNENTEFALRENYNLQKYPVGGGFKIWHFENDFKSHLNRHRALVFMTYLNDVEDGGTEFFHQNLSTPAKKGLTLIWPAYWTHTHRGIVSRLKEKYIVTGWINFINQL
jgi:hypothetical protein